MDRAFSIRRPWQVAAVLVLTLAATLATRSPAVAAPHRPCADADRPATRAAAPAMRNAVVCLINQERQSHHLPALRASSLLNRSAQGWTDRMVRTNKFTHGANFAARISAVGFNWSYAGENIATGFPTPRQVVSAWMASVGHCQNILSSNYAMVGTGVSTHQLGGYGPATWTQDFGLWMGQRPPSRNGGPAARCPYRV